MKHKFFLNYDKKIVPKKMNPELSEKDEKDLKFFLEHGYLVVDDALNTDEVNNIREAFNDTFKKLDNVKHIEVGLLEYDKRFLKLLDNEIVIKKIKSILGNCIQLHSATARLCKPGEPNQIWHRDGPWPVDPAGTPFGSIPGQVNCGYYLDELNLENGAFALVPGSHKVKLDIPREDFDYPDQKYLFAKPGQAILFSGWMYHRGMGNKSGSDRRVCLMCYQNAWIKSREDFNGPVALELKKNGSDEQKLLLGSADKW